MKLSIIVPDKTISLDGDGVVGINTDMSWIPENVHAVQWYDTWGEVEYNDGTSNERIEELGIYSQAVTDLQNAKQRIADEEARIAYDWEWNRDWTSLLRQYRTKKLTDSDWTQVPDSPLTEEQRGEWRTYRQELRNLPSSLTEEQYRELVRDENHELWPVPPT